MMTQYIDTLTKAQKRAIKIAWIDGYICPPQSPRPTLRRLETLGLMEHVINPREWSRAVQYELTLAGESVAELLIEREKKA